MQRVLLFFVAICGVFADHDQNKVQVDVFYESLCPDSISFITKQLYPTLQTPVAEHINLTLVPYGKATTKVVNGQYQFTCHHGNDECLGNRYHACAIEKADPDSALGTNKDTVGLISCLMEKFRRDPIDFPVIQCAQEFNIRNAANIQNCANHADGVNYLAKMGNKTEAFQSPLQSVPTIVFNGQYKKDDSSLAQSNFTRAVCQYIRGEHRPQECNSAGMISLTLVTLLACLFTFSF